MSKRLYPEGWSWDVWVSDKTHARLHPPPGTIRTVSSMAGPSGMLSALTTMGFKTVIEREKGDHAEALEWARLEGLGRHYPGDPFWGFDSTEDAFAFRLRFT